MKCFSLVASRQILSVPSLFRPVSFVAPEIYPAAREGIVVYQPKPACEIIPGANLFLSSELYASSHSANDVDSIVIDRASVLRRSNGTLWLVPEREGESNSALVWLDVSRGAFSRVQYEVGNCVHVRLRRSSDDLFGNEELALVEIAVGRPFHAFRFSRKWFCFGGERVGECLLISFDGRSLKCEAAE